MLGRCSLRIKQISSRVISVRNASSEEIKKYREANYFELSDRQSVKILHKDGRAFPPGTSMLPLYNLNTAEYFPAIKAVTLDGKDVEVPESYNANVKLVGVSFQGYGYELLTSWLDPFCKKYPQGASDNSVKTIQVCWNKYRFLSLFKNFFIRTIKSDIDPVLHNQTVVTFENMTPFVEFLLLPSVFTNYVYLLDRNNKIRWKGSGRADPNELTVLFEHVDQLLKEPRL